MIQVMIYLITILISILTGVIQHHVGKILVISTRLYSNSVIVEGYIVKHAIFQNMHLLCLIVYSVRSGFAIDVVGIINVLSVFNIFVNFFRQIDWIDPKFTQYCDKHN